MVKFSSLMVMISGRKNSFQWKLKARMPTMARPGPGQRQVDGTEGAQGGCAVDRGGLGQLAGRPMKNCRIRNVPNAVGRAGRISASSVSESPMPRISMNTGTIVTCMGTIMVARTMLNRTPRPLKSMRAKT